MDEPSDTSDSFEQLHGSSVLPTAEKDTAPSEWLPLTETKAAKTSGVIKRIIIVDSDGNEEPWKVGSHDEFNDLLVLKQAKYLIECDSGDRYYGFDALEENVKYRLGQQMIASVTLPKSFPYHNLPRPEDVPLPVIFEIEPPFVCNDDTWLQTVVDRIRPEFVHSDVGRTCMRVRPMALVGCRQSGKTRALKELARFLKADLSAGGGPLGVIYISFGDYSGVTAADLDSPLDALIRRIVFEASCQTTVPDERAAAYESFCRDHCNVDVQRVEDWLFKSRVILLIDELDKLLVPVASPGSRKTRDLLGDFLKRKFVILPGCYVIFSSHTVASLIEFILVVDWSTTSCRSVMLQTLPRVTDFIVAGERLGLSLRARNAIYYGLVPAMIYNQHIRPRMSDK